MNLAATILTAALFAGPASEVEFVAERLPPGWQLARDAVLDPLQVTAVAQKLGVPLRTLRQQVVDVRGFPLQVNLIEVEDDAQAAALVEVLSAGGRREFIARRGTTVVEFAKMNLVAAKALRHALGLAPAAPTTWRASFRVACVNELDYMEANRVFNAFLKLDEDPDQAALVRELTSDWRMGDRLDLRAPGPGFDVEYAFEPEPREIAVDGEVLRATFDELPRLHGLPFVDVRATIRVADRFAPAAPAAPGAPGDNVDAAWWPADSAVVADLAAKLTADCDSDLERLQAVFDHVAREIRFAGDVTGSRYGVERVLDQGYGHCWDKSDALTALCRAAGLRARQTAGWVPPLGSGHVWTEVHLSGRGWLPVDATCRWLGTSADYVPWFLTEDGEMPIVYLAMPQLERVE